MPYPHLQSFLHDWFHQDFDINGQSILEITSLYKSTAPSFQVSDLLHDIDTLLENHKSINSSQLIELLDMEVDPLGFSESACGFLKEIKAVLLRD